MMIYTSAYQNQKKTRVTVLTNEFLLDWWNTMLQMQ